MFGIGVQEMMFLAVLALLVFGPKRLPELARTLGKGLAEFRRASAEIRGALSLEPDVRARPPQTRRQEEDADPIRDRDYRPAPSQAVGGPDPETGEAGDADDPIDAARHAEAAVQAELADEANDERHRDADDEGDEGDANRIGRDEPGRTGRSD